MNKILTIDCHMKKIIIIAAALLLGFQAKAQVIAGAGLAMAFERTKTVGGETFPTTMFGIYAGANYYYSLDNLADGLAVLPGANFSGLFGNHWDIRNVRVRELALNIPVQASYTYEINEKVKIFGQTGPTFSLALSYKAKDAKGTTYPLLKKDNEFWQINVTPESRHLFNVSWGITAGAEVSDMLRIHLGVDFGFLNLNRRIERSVVDKISRTTLHVGVGYLF